jgi:hypothetical protein
VVDSVKLLVEGYNWAGLGHGTVVDVSLRLLLLGGGLPGAWLRQ